MSDLIAGKILNLLDGLQPLEQEKVLKAVSILLGLEP